MTNAVANEVTNAVTNAVANAVTNAVTDAVTKAVNVVTNAVTNEVTGGRENRIARHFERPTVASSCLPAIRLVTFSFRRYFASSRGDKSTPSNRPT